MSFAGSGFQDGEPLFVVDSGRDFVNGPTSAVNVYNTSSYADALAAEPSPLPASIGPGGHQFRACNQRPGEAPSDCVQIPFSVSQSAASARVKGATCRSAALS